MVNLEPVYLSDDENSDVVDHVSVAEGSDEEVEEDHTLPIEDHERQNQAVFHINFLGRSLDHRQLMLHVVNGASVRINASLLIKHCYCLAALYRRETFFKRSTLSAFIRLCRTKRREDPNVDDPHWERVRQNIISIGYLDAFATAGDLEKNLSEWFHSLAAAVAVRYPRFTKEKKLAIRGALAYTDPESGEADPRAAYYGYADYVFKSGSTLFAGVELKITRRVRNPLWYQIGSLLAQIVCWLGGTREMQVGLILTDKGFKLLYRQEVDVFNGIPVYEYFHCCFDGENDYNLNLMVGPGGKENRERLLRIVYEIVKVSGVNAEAAKAVAEKPIDNADKMSDKAPSDGEDESNPPKKRAKKNIDHENKNSGGENYATEKPVEEVMSSYKFYVRLSDGTLLLFEGMELREDTHV